MQPQRNAEIAIGFALRAAFGTNTLVDGLACTPTSPASLSVNVGSGAMIVNTTIDTLVSGFGSLPLDNTTPLVKIGINTATTVLGPFAAPGTAGQSQNYLIEASFSETDGTPAVLPYFDSALPSVPYSGPNNTGAAQNTKRAQTVTLQIKAGVAATTGSQTTPAADVGNTGLWVVTLANGNTTIGSGNITQVASAPFIPSKLGPGMNPGFSNIQAFTTPGAFTFTVPSGVTKIRVKGWGGGGGGGGVNGVAQSSGGSAGGYFEKILTVTPGQLISGNIGTAGPGGNGTPTNGTAGGTTTFGALSATGGGFGFASGGGAQSTTSPAGTGSGGDVNLNGLTGSGGNANTNGGAGGGSPFGIQGAPSGSVGGTGAPGQTPGAGGAGTASTSGGQAGGAGGGGMVIVEW